MDGSGLGDLAGADQEGEAAGGGYEGGGNGEDVFEALDGAEGDYVEHVGRGEVFGAGGSYIDVRQCKGAGDFAEEGGLLVVGFDESKGDLWGPEFDGEAGESGAGAEVGDTRNTLNHGGHRGHRGRSREQVAGGEKGFAEVAGDDFLGIADRSEVDAGVPTEQYIDVRRYMLELGG